MTATGRLFIIELRRSTALLSIPILLVLAWLGWLITRQGSVNSVPVWPVASVNIGLIIVFLGPAAGGLAAWAAGRERRSGLGDLLLTTPRPPTIRQLSILSATATWTVLAYVLAGLYFGVSTALDATWGGPVAAPILIGALTIAAHTAIGYAAGSFAVTAIQSRLTAALTPVFLFLTELAPILIRGADVQVGPNGRRDHFPYENLSPVELVEGLGGSIFWEPRSDVAWSALLWLGGLGAAALGLVAVRSRPRSPVGWTVVAVAAVAVVAGWIQLVPSPVAETSGHPIAYVPVCAQRSIPICLHPAYESLLDETADFVDPIIRPLVGLTGFPTRAGQLPTSATDPFGPDLTAIAAAPDTLSISPECTRLPSQTEAAAVALAAVVATPADPLSPPEPAQTALAIWLLRQAGYDSGDQFEVGYCAADGVAINRGFVDAATLAAVDRFAALTPEAQRAWLEANLASLRAGTIELEDLP